MNLADENYLSAFFHAYAKIDLNTYRFHLNMSNINDMVILTQTYIDRHGNMYDASPFEVRRGDLPAAIRNDPDYVRLKQGVLVAPVSEQEIERTVLPSASNTSEQPKNFKPQLNVIAPLDEVNQAAETLKQDMVEAETLNEVSDNKLNINEASLSELIALNGVGAALAQKVLKERERNKFESLDDLKKRVPLKFGKNWGELDVTVTEA